jgi:SNF2 family DNA or RNA helicase
MTLDSFLERYAKPIKSANKKSATTYDAELSSDRLKELRGNVLEKVFLQRKKTILNSLKGKSDLIVMCDVTPIQARVYKEILQLPEYEILLSDDHTRLPYLENTTDIDPRAVIWKKISGNASSQKSVTCCILPCIMKLLQISSHPGLLQVGNKDKKANNDESTKKKANVADTAQDKLDFLLNALKPETLALIGGVQRSTLMDGSRADTSGKMQTLDKLLKHFKQYGLKVLVFSHSVMMLDIIEDFVKVGCWNYIRLDGKTDTSQRQALCNQFNDPSKGVNLFLLSSRAGGLGLNLTAAYNVVIFDMDWNPSIDAQSQDRAYRIGQKEHVNVYRLVAKGTIEEIVYMRQLYKQEIAKSILDGDIGYNDYHNYH